ncbi:aromatic ring-hydroxylating oxygenase subunit alpha [Polyangium spumosum]|uniref:Rieske 2Fe-2S domain-containing protein n=1 Tax=Polyangium spumosum TaxID=889282 RepID=A0A6N7Q225_9BACT|nr:SRPBCC family protein [Polyangium spumosum]MRG95001.1 Rieske 2Fe-2S domain-containing protein [Polyangium spumosum]
MNDLGRVIPAVRYTSPNWLARELESVFGVAWLLAAHASEFEGAGAFTTLDIAGESILITRGGDGALRGFYNVCQHRGASLCAQSRGRAASFRCPYHHWEYGADGRLLRAPGAGSAALTDEGRPVSLRPVHCAERFGFIWISMAEAPPDLDAHLAPVATELARHRPEEYRLVSETVVEIEANWKASVDVNNEAYHLPMLHPELCDVVDARGARFVLRGDHSTVSLPIGRPGRDVSPDERASEALRGLLVRLGVKDFPIDGRIADVRLALARAFRERAAREGLDLSARSDDDLARKEQIHVFPNVQMNFLPFSLELYRHRPHPTDPSRSWFDELTFERHGSGAAPNPIRRRVRHGEHDLGPVMGADIDMLPRLQAGMRSRGFRALRLTEGELGIAHMHRVLEDWLSRGKAT